NNNYDQAIDPHQWLADNGAATITDPATNQNGCYIDTGRAENVLARSAEAKEDVDERSEKHLQGTA
ncbi:MAG: hypothetical protein FWG16_03470, partial [Micrococcales bacterium]|nr:hypothetical protein [Micrococcales bacterium]